MQLEELNTSSLLINLTKNQWVFSLYAKNDCGAEMDFGDAEQILFLKFLSIEQCLSLFLFHSKHPKQYHVF